MTIPTSIGKLDAVPAAGWRGYAKAITATVVAGITYLVGVIPAAGGFGDVTVLGWLGCILAMLAAGGAVYSVPNQLTIKTTGPD